MKQLYQKTTRLLLICVLFSCCNLAYAQERTITGTVTSRVGGTTLPGVNVLIKGTSQGTITDINGNYSISANDSDVLVFSFVGFVQDEVPVSSISGNTYSIDLDEDIQSLSEVVVIGYGTQEKKDVTGAMSTINAKDFNAGVINSPAQLFQGKLAGVQVTQNSGEPGGAIDINIRGASSIRAGNNPLYVVDGFPLDGREVSNLGPDFGLGTSSSRNPLNFINPDDIASIDVLKDASATAIYGSRGANGVVLITTKTAAPGELVLSMNSSFGISQLPKKIDLLSADEYVDAAVAAGAQASKIDFGGSTDWQDEIFRTGYTQSHSLSFAKGTDEGAYRVSLSYLDQDGIVETSNLERITARINASQKLIKDRLKLDYQLTVGHTNDRYVPISNNAGFEGSLIGAALQANPTIPVRRDDGTFVQRSETINGVGLASDFNNPAAMLELLETSGKTTRILGNIGASFTIAKGLDFRTNFGVDNSASITRINYNPDFRFASVERPGTAGIIDVNLSSYIIENFLTYKIESGNSKFELLGGYSYQEFNSRSHGFWVVDTELPNGGTLGYNNVGVGVDFTGQQQFSGNQTNKLQSYFTRAFYSYMDKYLFTGTVRTDGSSRFGENERYGVFPSLALAWRISEEEFAPDLFSDLKLRLGWGRTGNQEFANGTSQPSLGVEGGNVVQLTNDNPDIKWEETTQWNVGVDFSLLSGRFSGTVDYFDKSTTDLLVLLDVPQPAFTRFAYQNLDADLINTGLELSLNAQIVNIGDFSWDASANFTNFFKNEIEGLGTSFFNTGAISGQGLSGAYAQRIAEGQPLGAFYMLEFTGLSENGVSQYGNDNRLSFVGSALPDYIYGFTTNLRFKNLDLSLNFNGRGGSQVYNNTANALFTKGALLNGRNITPEVAYSDESPLNAPDVSTRYLEDGSFLRFNNFTLGYNFETENIEWLSKARIFLSGQNVFVLTDYSGYDPEVNVDKNINGVPSFGIDYTGFPKSRTFLVGVNFSF